MVTLEPRDYLDFIQKLRKLQVGMLFHKQFITVCRESLLAIMICLQDLVCKSLPKGVKKTSHNDISVLFIISSLKVNGVYY